MTHPFRILPLALVLTLGGCAAPFKALGVLSPAAPEAAALHVPDPEQRNLLKLALEKKAEAMRTELAMKKPRPASSALEPPDQDLAKIDRVQLRRIDPPRQTSRVTAPAEAPKPVLNRMEPQRLLAPGSTSTTAAAPAERSAKVDDMLAKMRNLTHSSSQQGVEKEPPLALAFHVKDENRLGHQAALLAKPTSPKIAFSGKATQLDTEGNRILAAMVTRLQGDPSARLMLVGGLAGTGAAGERLHLAAQRLETVAQHVPPPILVERRYDPMLAQGDILLDITKGAP